MQLKEFTERYDLHLLTTSHQGVQLGDLVWKRHWRSNRLQYRGMGSNVFNRLYDAELLSKTEWKKRLEEIKDPPCELAALAHLHLRNVDRISGIFLQQLQPEITLKKVMSLRVKNVCVRRLTDELRMDIDQKWNNYLPKAYDVFWGAPGEST